jgi:hypothetical protein
MKYNGYPMLFLNLPKEDLSKSYNFLGRLSKNNVCLGRMEPDNLLRPDKLGKAKESLLRLCSKVDIFPII